MSQQLGDENFSVTLFETAPVRRALHDGRWFYSIIDVVAVLVPTSKNPGRYWSDMKRRLHDNDGFAEIYAEIMQFKFPASDGKSYETDCLPIKDLVQFIQHIPALHRQKPSEQKGSLEKSGIYALVNTITREQYIGSSFDISARYLQHRSELRRGRHHSATLQAAWNQYSEDIFVLVILEEVADINELTQREQVYLNEENHAYNTAQVASNIMTLQPIDEAKLRRFIVFLEHEANMPFDAAFLQHVQFLIGQGIVIPGPKYHVCLQAAKAQITSWEAFQDYVMQA